jgi:hypothetical protein
VRLDVSYLDCPKYLVHQTTTSPYRGQTKPIEEKICHFLHSGGTTMQHLHGPTSIPDAVHPHTADAA